ncbi:MAG TPA: hypothetical protein PK816_09845 [Candidatus Cloacimonadota bacterium]|nr:hypothetical protein [Candidatus Cloacimonadota bacterium]
MLLVVPLKAYFPGQISDFKNLHSIAAKDSLQFFHFSHFFTIEAGKAW